MWLFYTFNREIVNDCILKTEPIPDLFKKRRLLVAYLIRLHLKISFILLAYAG